MLYLDEMITDGVSHNTANQEISMKNVKYINIFLGQNCHGMELISKVRALKAGAAGEKKLPADN